jgi:aspartate aminotransferase
MGISTKIQGFISQSSWIRKLFEEGDNLKRMYGADKIFDFSLGNPNVEPPAKFKELLNQAARDVVSNKHGYMPNAGYQETRESVASYLSHRHGVPLTHNHIIMTCGAGGALNVILKALLDQGDEVLIPAPFFVEYRFYVDNAGGVSKLVKTKSDFSLDLEGIDLAISEKTKIVLINSPNNPTGKVYDAKSIKGLADILRNKSKVMGKDIYLVSDEPYSDIVYDGISVPSILAAYHNTVIASSYSKSLSLPGERIGYLAVNPGITDAEAVIGAAVLCNRILGFVNAPALMQRVIANLQGAHVDVEEYRRKRDLLCDGLSSIGYRFKKPEGAFYLFAQSPIDDDVTFVNTLLKERIIAVPGSGFGGPGHFRIAYCVEDITITNAMDGFKKALKASLNSGQ